MFQGFLWFKDAWFSSVSLYKQDDWIFWASNAGWENWLLCIYASSFKSGKISIPCFLTFVGRTNAIQRNTELKQNMKTCKMLSIKLPFFFCHCIHRYKRFVQVQCFFFLRNILVGGPTARPEEVSVMAQHVRIYRLKLVILQGYFVSGSLPQSRSQQSECRWQSSRNEQNGITGRDGIPSSCSLQWLSWCGITK